MTVSGTTNRVPYAGNGSTTVFSYPHHFQSTSHLVVVLRVDSTGVETPKSLTTHYTVSGTATNGVYPNGGSVTMITAPASGETLIIYNDPTRTQTLDLVENDSLPAESLEQALDKHTLEIQRLSSRVDRAVRQTEGAPTTFDPKLPALVVADAVLAVNSAGTAFEYVTQVSGPAGAASSTDNAIARWDGTTGETLQNSSVTISDAGVISCAGNIDSSLTASRAVVTDGSKQLVSSAATATEVGYLSGVTSAIQTQIDALTTLADGKIYVGNASNVATEVTPTGDVTISNAGVTAIGTGVIVNADVNGSAAIDRSKMASGTAYRILANTSGGVMSENADITASRAVASDANGQLVASATTATELGYVSGVTSAIQTQLGTKITSGAGAIVNADINASAAIDRSKIAAGTAYGVVTNDVSGALTSVAPSTSGNVLTSNGTAWTSAAPAGGFTVSGLSAVTLANDDYIAIADTSNSSGNAKALASDFKLDIVAAKTGNYTCTATDNLLTGDSSGGAFTFTLPAAASHAGRKYTFIKIGTGTNPITIDGNASETISGALTMTLTLLYDSLVIVSDGANWHVLRDNTTSEVMYDGNNGRGSTDTSIAWFKTQQKYVGTGVTPTSNSTNGTYYTINEPGVYSVVASLARSANAVSIGITVNDSAKTTGASTPITYAQGLRGGVVSGATANAERRFAAWTGYLAIGDVVRVHQDSETCIDNSTSFFGISKVRG